MSTRPANPQHDPLDLDQILDLMKAEVDVQDRTYRRRTYRRCFVGSEACEWFVRRGLAADVEQAEAIGNLLVEAGAFHHVHRDHPFRNAYLFYRFADDEEGAVPADRMSSWGALIEENLSREPTEENLQPRIPSYEDELGDMKREDTWGVSPLDEHNARLLDNVHPRDWVSPTPQGRYNLVVVGAGAGGLVTAAAAAGLGARVALIEEHLLGGDCLNMGCVPSKALLRSAKVAATMRKAAAYGVHLTDGDGRRLSPRVTVDFGAVMERLRRLRAQISAHDSAQRFSRQLGVDVFIGRGTFTSPTSIDVKGTTLDFAKACIATGATPAIPPIPGLAETPYLTNMTLFNLTERPPRLGIIGGGVIGVEMAQAFQRLGSQVTIFDRGERILPREDPDAAAVVQGALAGEGVRFLFGVQIARVHHRQADGPFPLITVETNRGPVEVDALLVATGRKPNVDGLGLEAAGVEADPRRGVLVNDRLQTSQRHIYAVGDVATRFQFTHAADFMARIVVRNALFFGRDRMSALLIPWCTYTDPEIAHVGLYGRDLDERGIPYQTYEKHFDEVDRAILDGATEGFVRVHVKQGTDRIMGATIVGQQAGSMIGEVTLAMHQGIGLRTLANVIHPYPTHGEALRQVGDLYNRSRLTPTVRGLFRRLLKYTR